MTKRFFLLGWVIGCAVATAVAVQAQAQPPAKDPTSQLESLLKERRDTLRKLVQILDAQYKMGTVEFNRVARAQNRLADAELALAKTKDERIAICQQQVDLCRKIEAVTQSRFAVGTMTETDLLDAREKRLHAEIRLLKEKTAKTPPPSP